MSKVKSTKKGKKNSDTKAIYAELPTLESETPEQMLNKLGGVAGRSMHEQPGSNQPPLLTQHSLAVPNSPVDIAHSVGLEPRSSHLDSSHLDSSHLDGSHAGSSHLGSHQQLGDAPPAWRHATTASSLV